jgi:ABC-type uncharacterized transport system permease subunit
MPRKHRNAWEQMSAVFEGELRDILLWIFVQILVLAVAIAVGIVFWITVGWGTGMITGIMLCFIGQQFGIYIIDKTVEFPNLPGFTRTIPTEQEELDALREELKSTDNDDNL